MPIEFRCSQCDQLLRVPETAAGKHARCPRCQALMAVPGVATAVALPIDSGASGGQPPGVVPPPMGSVSPAAMPNSPFAPLPSAGEGPPAQPSTFAESVAPGVGPTGGAGPVNLYAAPPGVSYAPQFYSGGLRPGLPWENESQTVGCWFRTTGLIVSSPTYAFSIMRQYGGLGQPMLFSIYGLGLPVAAALCLVLPILLLIAVTSGAKNGEEVAGFVIIGLMCVVIPAIYVVLVSTIGALIGAAIHHLLLMMVGGARQSYETTFRVFCYSQGALFWCMLIPIPYLNAMIMGIWVLVVRIIGYSRGHEISGSRATLAVFLPLILCVGLSILVIFVSIGAGLLQH